MKKPYNWTDAKLARLRNLIEKGYTQVEMAAKFGVTIDKIRYAIEKWDLHWMFREYSEARKERAKRKKK